MSDKVQYTNAKVQPEDFTSGWKVAFIQMGLAVSLPMLYLGSEMALKMGLRNSIIAFFVSTALLTVLCMITTLIGNRSRLSTYMILRFPFGKQGAKFINLMIGICLLGWFAVALELLSDAIGETLLVVTGMQVPLSLIIIVGSIFIMVTTIYGIRTLEKLANVAVPILLVFLLYVVYIAVNGEPVEPATRAVPSMSLFEGISALIGSSILVPVLMADFSRYIYNDKQSLLSVLGVTIGTPLVFILAAILADKTGEVDIIQIMKNYRLVIPAFILIFVSTWVTNATNLYSASLTIATLSDKFTYTKLAIIGGVLGTGLALVGFADYFIDFLLIIGVFAPSIAAIYIIDFFYVRKQSYNLDDVEDWGWAALVSWGLGSAVALVGYYEIFSFTGAYFVDAFLVAGVGFFLLGKFWKE